MGTGAGKSLIYQLSAHLLSLRRPSCFVVVISPLIALIQDQVRGGACGGVRIPTNRRKIRTCPPQLRCLALHSGLSREDQAKVVGELVGDRPSRRPTVLFMCAEKACQLASDRFQRHNIIWKLPPITFVCLDEAHCLSLWGRDFRPAYRDIVGVMRSVFRAEVFLALTATATPVVVSDIRGELGGCEVVGGQRSSLSVRTALITASPMGAGVAELKALLASPDYLGKRSIVYCQRRRLVDQLESALAAPNNAVVVVAYHGGMSPEARESAQTLFTSGQCPLMVATLAFGMGVDVPDLDGIVHYGDPSDFEAYVQQIGRAIGRAKRRVRCHVFTDPLGNELERVKRHVYERLFHFGDLRRLVQAVWDQFKQSVHHHFAQGEEEEEEEEEPTSPKQRCVEWRCTVAVPLDYAHSLDLTESRMISLLHALATTAAAHQQEIAFKVVDTREHEFVFIHFHTQPSTALRALKTHQSPYGRAKHELLNAILNAKHGCEWETKRRVRFSIVRFCDEHRQFTPTQLKRMVCDLEWTRTAENTCKKLGLKVELSAGLCCVVECCAKCPKQVANDDEVVKRLCKLVNDFEENNIEYRLNNIDRLSSLFKTYSRNGRGDEENCERIINGLNGYLAAEEEDEQGRPADEHAWAPNVAIPTEQIRRQCLDLVENFVQIYGSGYTAVAIARIFWAMESPQHPYSTWRTVRNFWGQADRAFDKMAQVIPFYMVLHAANEVLLTHRTISRDTQRRRTDYWE